MTGRDRHSGPAALSWSCLPEPVGEPPKREVPPGPAHAVERVRDRSNVGPPGDWYDRPTLHEEIVQPDELRCTFRRIELALRPSEERVVFLAPPARGVVALPVVPFLRDVPGGEQAEEPFGVRARGQCVGEELQVGVEMRVRVRIRRVRAEERRGLDALEFDFDPRLRGRLLDDLLDLLGPTVDGSLKEKLEALTVLRSDTVGATFPASRVEELVDLVDTEVHSHALRDEARRSIDHVDGGNALAAINVLL